MLSSTTAPIKAVLLDQSRLVCGIGNWVCDDVLYESKIHPATRSCDLSIEQVTALMQAIASVCKQACDVGADATRFPEHWLFHPRWKMRPKTSQTLPDGRYLVCETLSGRSTVYVPAEQKKGTNAGGGARGSAKSTKVRVKQEPAEKPAIKGGGQQARCKESIRSRSNKGSESKARTRPAGEAEAVQQSKPCASRSWGGTRRTAIVSPTPRC